MIRTSTAVLCCALVWLLLAVGRCEKYKRTFFLSFPAQDRGHSLHRQSRHMRRRKVWLLAGDFESSIRSRKKHGQVVSVVTVTSVIILSQRSLSSSHASLKDNSRPKAYSVTKNPSAIQERSNEGR
jgi:hypothetical protein